jgi:anti-anti-sigma factor
MLNIRIQMLGDVTVIQCVGRIVLPYEAELRNAVLHHRPNRTLVLDLAHVIAVDAAGLGMLTSLQSWSQQTRTALKLMNVTPHLEELLELTNLRSAFEVCSCREMLALLCSAINEAELVGLKAVIQETDPIGLDSREFPEPCRFGGLPSVICSDKSTTQILLKGEN